MQEGFVFRLTDQVERIAARRPGIRAAMLDVVPTEHRPTGIQNRLLGRIRLCTSVMRTGAHEAELRCSFCGVVLKMQSVSSTSGIRNGLSFVDRCGSSRLPVHSVEDHEKDVFLSIGKSSHLQVVDVRLIHVFCGRIDRMAR